MNVKKGKYITALEVNELMAQSDKTYYKSRFRFIKSHNGYRPGNFHLLIGTSGGGKSTVVRSLLVDLLPSIKKRILVWLSEETHQEFIREFGRSGIYNYGKELKNKIDFYSEQESSETMPQMKQRIKSLLENEDYEFIIFDNLTTSRLYMDRRPNEQAEFSLWLKAICQNSDTAALLVAHTGAEISDNMNRFINANDIRGAKSIVNLSQFIYILQRFINEAGEIFQMLRLDKNRGQDAQEKLFLLEYDRSMVLYQNDRILSYDMLKEIFKNRRNLR